ncbi:phosphoserine phosphatase SerB [Rhodoligotrophos defluvii]|uniref:phosphoserine phosphatase SerB n=1 Tax=Rhodoligotrophos defluvii TaxID=2561934 RepID=UPI0010C981F0|nr:phosphoserine phosphatase SerB [Rhodoligotrophos defluvii]
MDTVLLLIASGLPGAPVIAQGEIEAVRRPLGLAQPARWLSPGKACEWSLPLPASDHRRVEDELRQRLGPAPIDVAVIPAANRRKALLVADMDSTIIGQECIDELAVLAGVGDKISAITERAMRGELAFEEALEARVAMLKGLASDAITRVIRERITFTPGGRQLVQTMRAHGARTALVSGGFTAFTAHVAEIVGFDHHHGNTLVVENEVLTGEVGTPILGRDAKLAALRELCASAGIALADALTVGDGANDIPMLEAAGLGVAFHAKPKARDAAAVRIDHGDLTALLYLQGYTDAEFRS